MGSIGPHGPKASWPSALWHHCRLAAKAVSPAKVTAPVVVLNVPELEEPSKFVLDARAVSPAEVTAPVVV